MRHPKTSVSTPFAWWSCLRKVRYNKAKSAKQRAKKLNSEYYSCNLCGGFHITRKKRCL